MNPILVRNPNLRVRLTPSPMHQTENDFSTLPASLVHIRHDVTPPHSNVRRFLSHGQRPPTQCGLRN
jgi:hypothetical protein